MEKFLEIKNKEKELDQAKNALFDFEEGQKDVSSTESASTEVHNPEHSEQPQSGEEKSSSTEEEIINLHHNDQIRDILQHIDPAKSNQTGIEIELKLKVPEKNKTITEERPGENKTLAQGTELVLKLNGIKQGEGETASSQPPTEETMENKTLVQKLNLIKKKQKEIASAKSSILTDLDVKDSRGNASLSSEVKLADNHLEEKGDPSELVEKIKDIKDKEIELKEAKTLLFTDAGKSDQDNSPGIGYSCPDTAN